MQLTTEEGQSFLLLCFISFLSWLFNIYAFNKKEYALTTTQKGAAGLFVLWTPLQWMKMLATRRELVAITLSSSALSTAVRWWATIIILNDHFKPTPQQTKSLAILFLTTFTWDAADLLIYGR